MPFRGFVQERVRLVELGKSVGKMLLFFGCQSEGSDFLYREECDDWKKELGERFEIVTAFSRTQRNDMGMCNTKSVDKLRRRLQLLMKVCGLHLWRGYYGEGGAKGFGECVGWGKGDR